MIVLPIGVEPVKPSLRTCGWSAIACPTMEPVGKKRWEISQEIDSHVKVSSFKSQNTTVRSAVFRIKVCQVSNRGARTRVTETAVRIWSHVDHSIVAMYFSDVTICNTSSWLIKKLLLPISLNEGSSAIRFLKTFFRKRRTFPTSWEKKFRNSGPTRAGQHVDDARREPRARHEFAEFERS